MRTVIGHIEGTGEALCWQEWRGRGLGEKASQSYPSHWQDAFPESGRVQTEPQEAWRPESAVPAESCGYLHAAALWLFEGGRGQEVGLEGL